MAFSDPIVGTEVLIRNQIQSENFSVDPETGVTGWQIKRDGTATFNQLVIGSPFFNIDENGDAVFHSITLTADDDETAIFIHGEDIDPELYNHKSRGIIALTTLSGNSAAYTGTPIEFGSIIIPAFDITRQYVIGGSDLHFDKQAVTTIDRINFDVYLNWGAPADTGDTLLFSHQESVSSAIAFDQDLNFWHPWKNETEANDGVDAHLAFFFRSEDTSANGLRVQAGTAARIYVMDVGETVAYGSYDMDTGTPPAQQYVKTYSANGSASYQGDDDIRSGIDECYQGQYSSTNGNQYSVILFPYSTIASDLSGATIDKVEVYLNNNHWYNNSGGTAVIGYHNSATTPASFTYPSSTDNITQSSFTYGQAKWVTVDDSIGTAFKNGTAKGILLGKGQTAGGTLSTSKTYYGYFAGNGQSGEPQLRITYTV